MNPASYRIQYRKFRILLSRFFSYWFFLVFATLGTAFAVMERFLHIFHLENLETVMILVLCYAILIYIVNERAKVLDDIQDSLKSSRARVYPARESVYSAIPLIIAKASSGSPARRRIFHAALHGHSGKRIARPAHPDPMFDLFDREIDRCVASSGAGMWRVYEIFNITNEERLDTIVELLGKRQDAEGYEVRAFSLADSAPHLSPLIVGDQDLLLCSDDPRYYRAGAAIHLQGRDNVRLATEYFYTLWNDARVQVLKTETGVDWAEIDRLRARIRDREGVPLLAG